MKNFLICAFLIAVGSMPTDAQTNLISSVGNPLTTADQNTSPHPPTHFTSKATWVPKTLPAQAVGHIAALPHAFSAALPRTNSASPGPSGPWLQTRTPLPAGEVPTSVAVGSFFGSGKTDWVVANGYDDNLWLYKGNGDGTSALPTILPLKGTSPLWVTTADLRKVGRSDILVAEHDSNSIGVLISNGDGTFQPEQSLAITSPDFVTTVDVNGDGYLDVVAGATGCASVFLGNGHGAFQSAIQSCATPISQQAGYSAPAFTTFLSFADFNKDGKLDILISNPNVGVGMLVGDGSGHFSSPIQIVGGNVQLGYFYFTSTAIDFNGDGCPDVAAGDVEGKVFLFAGDCAGNFKHPAALSLLVGDVPAQLSVADINGDGHPDLVASGMVSVWGLGGSRGHLLMVALGDGQGGFQHSQVYPAGEALVGFAIGDLNGDGKPDVLAVAQNEDALYEFLNDGTGNFGAPQGRAQFSTHGNNNQEAYINNTGGDAYQLLQDINGDGKKDVVYIDYADLEKTWSVATTLNLGAAGFADPVFSTINTDGTGVLSDALGDFHGTGQPDIVFTTYGGPSPNQVYLMQNLGNGKFGSPQAIFSRAIVADGVFATDLNKDGKQDLLVFELVGSSYQIADQIDVLLGNGNGTFKSPVTYSLPSTGEYGTFFAGDFNGDGNQDVLLYLDQNVLPRVADIVEFLGNGDGTLQAGKLLLGTPGLPAFALLDINHDGRPDIVAPDTDEYSPAITTYFGQADGTFAVPQIYNGFATTRNAIGVVQIPVAGDFNLDGKNDVLVPLNQPNTSGSGSWWAQFYTTNQAGTLIPTEDILPFGEVKPLWMTAAMDTTGASSLVEFNNLSASFDVLPGTTAPPIQLFLQSESIIGGAIGGTIILNQAATADTTVNLQASDPALGGQASVLIPASSTTGNFTFHATSSLNPLQVVGITATLGTYNATAYAFDQGSVTGITVEAPSLAFGLQNLNTTSAPLTIEVINDTANPLTLTNIVFDPYGSPRPDFSETDNCHSAISGFGTCTFNITFTPTVGSKEVDELDFIDPTTGQVYRFLVTGTGAQAHAQLTPASLSFGPQTVGTVSASQTALLANIGSILLNVSSTTVSGPFQIQNSCSAVQPGTPCQIQLAFAPTASGPQTGTLTVVSDGAVPSSTLSLTGTGLAAPTIAVSPSSLSFPAQLSGTTSSSQTVTATNSGSSAITISNIATSGPFLQSNNCPASLASAASCQITVQFRPPSGAASQGTLTIGDNAAGNPQAVSLTGQGVSFSIGSTVSTQTVTSGGTATFSLTASETAAYPESLTFACAGVPTYAACSFNPATVSLSSTTAVPISLTISTTSTSASLTPVLPDWRIPSGVLAAVGIPLLLWRRRLFQGLRLLAVFIAAVSVLTISSCGGSSASPGSTTTVRDTPPGSYNITVNGTGPGVSIQQAIVLIVQ